VREIGAFEAKSRLGQLLDWVKAGEDVIITRRYRPVAKLVSPNAGFDRDQAYAAAARIRARRRGL
jgi:prevent-host-death family protein